MKTIKSIITIILLLTLSFNDALAQAPNYFPQINNLPTPQDAPQGTYYDQNSNDRFDPQILQAKQGDDGVWYCLVAWNMISHDKSRKPNNRKVVDQGPGSSNWIFRGVPYTGYYASKGQSPAMQNYNTSIPGLTDAKPYRFYTGNYGGKLWETGLVWLPANYVTDTHVGIVPAIEPVFTGQYGLIVPVWYSYKSGFLGLGRSFDTYYVNASVVISRIIRK